jgi:hypothetical protein
MDYPWPGLSYSAQRRRIKKTVDHNLALLSNNNLAANDVLDCDVDDELSMGVHSQNGYPSDSSIVDSQTEQADLPFVSNATCPSSISSQGGVVSNTEFDLYNEQIYFDDYCDDVDEDYDDDDDDDDLYDEQLSGEQLPLAAKLADWAVEDSVALTSVSKLLAILQPYHNSLPLDARTLLKTPRNYEIRNLANSEGQYYHFGIERGISLSLRHVAYVNPDSTLNLQFNIDGLPLFKSSSTEFWPILCLVKECAAKPFVVGLYCGKGKPVDVSDFLKDLLNELLHLLSNGFRYQNTVLKIAVDCFVCDAPARAYLKNVKSHCAYFGCDKCKVEGEYVRGRMTFPNTNSSLRTDAEFLAMIDEEHHHGTTPLAQLPIGLVSDFVLDYMHLVCLGVVRRMLNFWLKGPVNTGIRLRSYAVQLLSDRLKVLTNEVPREFGRRPRTLTEIDRWKAVEFRQFLLYTGVVVLPGIVANEVFDHFMLLSVGIMLLVHPIYHAVCNDYAHELLKMFVEQSVTIYGPEFVVYNVHCLVHLAAEAKQRGCLDSFSAFPYENELKTLKRLVRKAAVPLSQVVRRLSEKNDHQSRQNLHLQPDCVVKCEHFNGPVLQGFESGQQFSRLRFRNLFVRCDSADNCIVVKDVGPVLVKNIIQMQNQNVYIVCQTFKNLSSVFSYPLGSSGLSIFEATDLSDTFVSFPVTNIEAKCVRLPSMKTGSRFVIFPLLHFAL